MAGDWIKIEHWTQDKPEVFVMADALGIDADEVLGKLIRVWVWADQQTTDGNAISVTFSLLDRVSGCKGFAEAMLKAGWLTQVSDGVRFVNFDRHNGETAKTRAQTAKRVRKHRTGNAQSVTSTVTEALPEKRREEIETTKREAPKTQKPERTGGLDEIVIPSKMDTSECRRASEMWFAYLDEKGLSDKRPNGAIALQCWWSQMARIGPKKFPEAVEASIAKGLWNVVAPQEATAKAVKIEGGDWLKVLEVCKQHSGATQQDTEARKAKLSERQYAAAKRVGIARIAAASSYDQKQLEQEFKHAIGGQS